VTAVPKPVELPDVDGPFVLVGPVARADPTRVPLRGDLAHIGLAGRYFVPHYAVPQPRTVGPDGAALLADPDLKSDVLAQLAAGATFEVLEISGNWAWGCCSLDGPVGYVALGALVALT
jgi:hypothetical protein